MLNIIVLLSLLVIVFIEVYGGPQVGLDASVSVSVGITFDSARDNDWVEFKKRFNRKYKNEDEENNKRKIWEDRFSEIDRHNEDYKQKKKRFKLGCNKFADADKEEMKRYRGYKCSSDSTQLKGSGPGGGGQTFNLSDSDPNTKKGTMDWRKEGAVTEIKNQEACGSCWSFAAAGALEGQHQLVNGKLVDLSEQNLIDCSSSLGNNGCNGGAMIYAFQYVVSNGIMAYSNYPYKQREGRCRYDPNKAEVHISGFVNIPSNDEEALQKAVAAVGPITVAIDASHDSFTLYEDGIYDDPHCSSTAMDHAVLCVGYGTDNGEDYWLIKNSWGTDWGKDGYAKIARNNNNQCGIASQASYPVI